MAFDSANLQLRAGAPGDLTYTYDAGTDTLATVAAAGYFNNTDDSINLVADDLIFVQAGDGNMWLRVASVSSGSVTTQFAGGDLPPQTWATGTAADIVTLSVGAYDLASDGATATRAVLPTPYPGARVRVVKTSSATGGEVFDAGGSGATGVTFGSGGRRILLQERGEFFEVVGQSTTRWALTGFHVEASAVMEGGSRFLAGT